MKIFNYYLILINIIGFILILVDKIKACKNKWRIKENTLLFISIIGGSIGELISMLIFHHKTKKNKFIIFIPLLILIQIIIYLYLKK
ncbi:putative uncharacterized protein [Mycoplasma sp. CAG:877]|nr:putative uncharacterized protein [Mycoplasma sp. CAG:877]